MSSFELVLAGIGILIALILLARFLALPVWLEAKTVNLSLGVAEIIGMRLRGTNPAAVVRPAITAKVAGTPVDIQFLEAHLMAGGRVQQVVNALIEAKRARVEVGVEELARADLDGRDPVEMVRGRAICRI